MAKVDDLKADNAKIAAALTNIQGDVNSLKTQILALNDKIAALQASAVTEADLDALKAQSAALVDQAEAIAAQTPDEPSTT